MIVYGPTQRYIVMGLSPLFQQSGARGVWTADSSALLEWRNKLIQHYVADREDESRQLSASGDPHRPSVTARGKD